MNLDARAVKKLGTILTIWAHPDDESFCAGGIMAAAVQNGQRVAVITATRGDAGNSADELRWPKKNLKAIREKELQTSLQILGVHEHYWLDYNDGALATTDSSEAINKISALIKEINPQTIISFGEDGITGHTDHQTIHSWTKLAIKKSNSNADFYNAIELTEFYNFAICQTCHKKFNIYFNIEVPHTVSETEASMVLKLDESLQQKKYESICAHQCQFHGMLSDEDGNQYIKKLCQTEAFMRESI